MKKINEINQEKNEIQEKLNQVLKDTEKEKENYEKNLYSKQKEIEDYERILDDKEKEIEELKDKLAVKEERTSIKSSKSNEIKPNDENNLEKDIKINYKNEEEVKKVISNLKNQKELIQKELDDLKQDYNNLYKKNNELEEEGKTDKLIIIQEYQQLIEENKKKIEDNENQIKNLNDKCISSQILLSEKEEEIEKLKKEKTLSEKEKFKNISSHNYEIIGIKKIRALTWYLLHPKNIKDKNLYSNYIWASENDIKPDDYNKDFEDSEKQLKLINLNNMKKLEEKEDQISKLKLKNEKLTEKLNNKSSYPGNIKNSFQILNSKNKTNSYLNTFADKDTVSIDIYQNLLTKYNESNKAMTNLQKIYNEKNEESENLKQKLKDATEKLKIKNDVENNCSVIDKGIDNISFTIDKEEEKDINGVIKELSEKKSNFDNKEEIKIMNVPYQEDESTENLFNAQLNALKDEIRSNREKIQQLEIIKNQIRTLIIEILIIVKIDNKIKPYFSQISQIFNFNDEEKMQIIEKKKIKKKK